MMTANSETLEEVLGELPFWNAYVVDTNDPVNAVFWENQAIEAGYDETNPLSPSFGSLFLQNLVFVDTLITRCELDLVVYAPVIPDMIAEYSDTVERLELISHDDDGFIKVFYRQGCVEGVPVPSRRVIYFPRYVDSGHMVTLVRPGKFMADVARWLGGGGRVF